MPCIVVWSVCLLAMEDRLRLKPKNAVCPDDSRGVEHFPIVTAEESLRDFAERLSGRQNLALELGIENTLAIKPKSVGASAHTSFSSVAKLFADSSALGDNLAVAMFFAPSQSEERGV